MVKDTPNFTFNPWEAQSYSFKCILFDLILFYCDLYLETWVKLILLCIYTFNALYLTLYHYRPTLVVFKSNQCLSKSKVNNIDRLSLAANSIISCPYQPKLLYRCVHTLIQLNISIRADSTCLDSAASIAQDQTVGLRHYYTGVHL